MKSLQAPYKLCRSKPWHNETTSSGWECKHLSTASTALLQNSIAQAARSKRNRTFSLHLRSMFTQCQFHGENLHNCSDRLVYKCRIWCELLEKYQSYSQLCLYREANIFISETRAYYKIEKACSKKPGLSTNGPLNNYPEFSQLMKHCCEILVWKFRFHIQTKWILEETTPNERTRCAIHTPTPLLRFAWYSDCMTKNGRNNKRELL